MYDEGSILEGCSAYDDGSQEQRDFIAWCLKTQQQEYGLYLHIRTQSIFGHGLIDRFAFICSKRAPRDNFWFNVTACVQSNYFVHVIADIRARTDILIRCQAEVFDLDPIVEFGKMTQCVQENISAD